MSQFNELVIKMLVSPHRNALAAFRQDDYFRLSIRRSFAIYAQKCANNAFENTDTFGGWVLGKG